MKHFNQQQKIRAVKGPRVRYMKGVSERQFSAYFCRSNPKISNVRMYYYILLILIVYCLMLTGKNAEKFYFVIK